MSKTVKKTTTKSKKTTKKTTKTKVVEPIITPNRQLLEELEYKNTGIGLQTEITIEVQASGSKIIKVPVGDTEGKTIKLIASKRSSLILLIILLKSL